MTMINPFLLAGPDQIRKYQENRIKEWEKRKGESKTDFDHYFSQLVDQWEMDDFNETIIPINEFESLDGIDINASTLIHNALKSANILNGNGYINLKQLDISNLIAVLNDLSFLSEDQKTALADILTNIQSNRPQDFETFTRGMFTYLPTNPEKTQFSISEMESNEIWEQLNNNLILDDFGILLVKPNSPELQAAVNALTGISSNQKERVLQLLNQHPELSYHSYISSFNFQENSVLPGAGVYLPDGADIKKTTGLTKEELNYIRIVALLEWNVMLISQKAIHKSRKKSNAKVKAEKKKDKIEFEKHLAELAARSRQESNKRDKSKPKA
ncbi:MAG: hypothetical protein VW397_01580 [Candidatus Margulisiibacteriota bacterium]